MKSYISLKMGYTLTIYFIVCFSDSFHMVSMTDVIKPFTDDFGAFMENLKSQPGVRGARFLMITSRNSMLKEISMSDVMEKIFIPKKHEIGFDEFYRASEKSQIFLRIKEGTCNEHEVLKLMIDAIFEIVLLECSYFREATSETTCPHAFWDGTLLNDCEVACEVVGKMSSLEIIFSPVVNFGCYSGCNTKEQRLDNSAFAVPTYDNIFEPMVTFLHHFKWKHILFVNDYDIQHSISTIQDLMAFMKKTNIKSELLKPHNFTLDTDEYGFSTFENVKEKYFDAMTEIKKFGLRILILFLRRFALTNFMLAAHSLNMTNGSYVFFAFNYETVKPSDCEYPVAVQSEFLIQAQQRIITINLEPKPRSVVQNGALRKSCVQNLKPPASYNVTDDYLGYMYRAMRIWMNARKRAEAWSLKAVNFNHVNRTLLTIQKIPEFWKDTSLNDDRNSTFYLDPNSVSSGVFSFQLIRPNEEPLDLMVFNTLYSASKFENSSGNNIYVPLKEWPGVVFPPPDLAPCGLWNELCKNPKQDRWWIWLIIGFVGMIIASCLLAWKIKYEVLRRATADWIFSVKDLQNVGEIQTYSLKAKRSAFKRWNARQNSPKASGKRNQNSNNDERRGSSTREQNSVVRKINSGSEKTATERRRKMNSDKEKSASGMSTVEQRPHRNSGEEKEDYFDLNVEQRRSRNSGRDERRASTAEVSLKTNLLDDESVKLSYYKDRPVALRVVACKPKKIDILHTKILHDIMKVKDLNHRNVSPILGICPNPVILMTLPATRGSLRDIFMDETHRRVFNLTLMTSLLIDAAKGMEFLHSTELGSHGRMTSAKFLVDSKWTCKVSGYGLASLRNVKDKKSDAAYRSNLLYLAPELLRLQRSRRPVYGSKRGDIYAFSIIIQEAILMDTPYALNLKDNISVKEILVEVKSYKNEHPYRPHLGSQAQCSDVWRKLEFDCWNENADERPSFTKIVSRLKNLAETRENTFVELMTERLEEYSLHLKDMVTQKTADIEEENKKSDNLLYSLLPRVVADALRDNVIVAPESYESITTLYVDIVGFTKIAALSTPLQICHLLGPQQTVELLSGLYLIYDELTSKRDAYKVETIGDCYNVVSGCPIRNGNKHAFEISILALDIIKVVSNYVIPHIPGQLLQARVGVHSGPALAGVVGVKTPRYCIVGKTGIIGEYLESTSEPNKINISAVTVKLLPPNEFVLVSRGITTLDSIKLEIETFFLTGTTPKHVRPKDYKHRQRSRGRSLENEQMFEMKEMEKELATKKEKAYDNMGTPRASDPFAFQAFGNFNSTGRRKSVLAEDLEAPKHHNTLNRTVAGSPANLANRSMGMSGSSALTSVMKDRNMGTPGSSTSTSVKEIRNVGPSASSANMGNRNANSSSLLSVSKSDMEMRNQVGYASSGSDSETLFEEEPLEDVDSKSIRRRAVEISNNSAKKPIGEEVETKIRSNVNVNSNEPQYGLHRSGLMSGAKVPLDHSMLLHKRKLIPIHFRYDSPDYFD